MCDNLEEIQKLKLHEEIDVGGYTIAKRVPNGLLYITSFYSLGTSIGITSSFVPFNDFYDNP